MGARLHSTRRDWHRGPVDFLHVPSLLSHKSMSSRWKASLARSPQLRGHQALPFTALTLSLTWCSQLLAISPSPAFLWLGLFGVTRESQILLVHPFLHKDWYLLLLCPHVASGRVRLSLDSRPAPPPRIFGPPVCRRALKKAVFTHILILLHPTEAGVQLATWWW